MKELLLGLAAGALVGTGVAAFGALRAKTSYEAQGADAARALAARGAQVQAALTTGGNAFRTELEALAQASAKAIAMGRAATLLRAYGLDASTLAKLERYRDAIT